jgi:CheY-like chemotaxis protein
MKKLLVVEDDEYKATDLIKTVEATHTSLEIKKAASVTSALKFINEYAFDLVILDMSLPTFDISGPGGGGSPQGQGGVEVLRLAGRLKNKSSFVVVTQYPDIEIDGRETSLESAPIELARKFGVNVLGCLLYEFDDDSWRIPLQKIITAAGI